MFLYWYTHSYVVVHMVRTDDIKTEGLTKKSSQGENLFPCSTLIISCIVMVDFVAL